MTTAALPDVLVGPVSGRAPQHSWRGVMIDSARKVSARLYEEKSVQPLTPRIQTVPSS